MKYNFKVLINYGNIFYLFVKPEKTPTKPEKNTISPSYITLF